MLEKDHNKIFTEREIGKATINISTEKKDEARPYESFHKEQKHIEYLDE